MCKLYLQPVEVQTGSDGHPFSFRWRDKWYLITSGYSYEIHPRDYQWYRSMGLDPYRLRYRCITDMGMDCDLVKEKGNWILERVWD